MGDVGICDCVANVFNLFDFQLSNCVFSGELKLIYQFRNQDSQEIIEKEFPMGEAPTNFIEDGKVYQRYFGGMTVIYGPSFNTEGQVKFKRGPIESDLEYT